MYENPCSNLEIHVLFKHGFTLIESSFRLEYHAFLTNEIFVQSTRTIYIDFSCLFLQWHVQLLHLTGWTNFIFCTCNPCSNWTEYTMTGFQHVDTTKAEKHKRWRGCLHKNAQWALECLVLGILSDRYDFLLMEFFNYLIIILLNRQQMTFSIV